MGYLVPDSTRFVRGSASEVVMRFLVLALVVVAAISSTSHAQQSKYYELSKGDYPHDVAVGPNREVWYAGQKLGIAGRLDPATGRSTAFRWARTPLRTASSSGR